MKQEVLTADDLQLICTDHAAGTAWWQYKHTAKSHISGMFRGPEPKAGDLIISVDEDDVTWAEKILYIMRGQITLSVPYMMDVAGRDRRRTVLRYPDRSIVQE